MEIKSGIYKIVNKVTGKCYVGSAVNFEKRFTRHSGYLNNGNHHSIKLQNSWNKYGSKNFQFIIIEFVPILNNLINREQYWISFFNAASDGYNMSPSAGSRLGITTSEETKLKMSIASKGKPKSSSHIKNMKNRVVSLETRKKLSEKNRKYKHTPEAIEKIRLSSVGKKHSPESKIKLSLAHTGKTLSVEHREKLKIAQRKRFLMEKFLTNAKEVCL